jgi:hypothetical protein
MGGAAHHGQVDAPDDHGGHLGDFAEVYFVHLGQAVGHCACDCLGVPEHRLIDDEGFHGCLLT